MKRREKREEKEKGEIERKIEREGSERVSSKIDSSGFLLKESQDAGKLQDKHISLSLLPLSLSLSRNGFIF